jgi:hypothetical protein
MKKLSLKLDALAVETFETAAAPDERGTVEGRAPTLLKTNCTMCQTYCVDTCTCVTSPPNC